ncbi:hypothetical protein [Candidatus Nephthysia bennettiae]
MLDGRVVEQEGHLRRLAVSVRAVYGLQLPDGLDRQLEGLRPLGSTRVRLSVWPVGGSLASEVEVEPHLPRPGALRLIPVTIGGGLGCHKWRDRSWLNDQRLQHDCDADSELLLLDSDREVLETERAAVLIVEGHNLVAAPDDTRRLPSLTSEWPSRRQGTWVWWQRSNPSVSTGCSRPTRCSPPARYAWSLQRQPAATIDGSRPASPPGSTASC